jgi:DNA-binding MarR family transcriptional regulator
MLQTPKTCRNLAAGAGAAAAMVRPSSRIARRNGAEGAQAPPTFGPLADMVGFHLRLAQEASFRAFAHRVGARDLKPRRFAILLLIDQNPGLTQTALSRASGRDKSTLTPALDDLERRGLIERRRCAKDRRAHALYLTDGGRSLLREIRRHAAAHDRQLDRILGTGKAQFLAALRRIAMSLG